MENAKFIISGIIMGYILRSYIEFFFKIAKNPFSEGDQPLINPDSLPKSSIVGDGSSLLIDELIEEGWDFFLRYGENDSEEDIPGFLWEADFTRRGSDGLWDNHESGYGTTAEEAVRKAYKNIKEGKRLRRRD